MRAMRGPAVVLLGAALLAAAVTGSGSAVVESVVPYPAPAGQPLSAEFSVAVRSPGGSWQELDVYEALVDKDTYSKSAMVLFDAEGPVEVAVTRRAGTIRSARVRPLSYGIPATVDADRRTARFVLPRPLNVSFEVNGDILRNLQVFAGPIEDAAPRPGTKAISFPPGRHVLPGDHILRVPSDTTVTIAGGAVVEGSIDVVGVENVVIRGRGVIDPSRFFLPKTRPTINIEGSRRVGVRDITLLRAQDGAIHLADARDVAVAGVRMITADPSSDGLNIAASSDVLADGVFLRTSDDSVAVYGTTPWSGHGSSSDITVRNSTLWADVAHAFMSGTHGNPEGADVMERLTLQNVDVLEHDEFRGGDLYQGALALNAGDRITVRDVRFDDIRIEDFSRGQVVNLKVFRNRDYNRRVGLGIERVLFRNVTYTGSGDAPSRIRGYMRTRRVRDVTFEDFVRNGQTVLEPAAGNVVVGPHTTNVVFRRGPRTRTVDGGSGAVRYTGRWLRVKDPSAQSGAVRRPLAAGSVLSHRFRGTQARVIGVTGPAGGKVDVYLDGSPAGTVDTYSLERRARQIWFDTGVLARGVHTVELRYGRSRNVLSAGASVAFDALEIAS